MTKVMVELSMSLDGYVTGPDVSPEEPMGRGGEALRDWMFKGRSAAESENAHYSGIGAVIVGRPSALRAGPYDDVRRRSSPKG
jgi:hypothetical protein